MIVLENLRKSFVLNGAVRHVASNINAVFPAGRSVALLGRNGVGKSTLLKMIAGADRPTSGRVICHGSVSWPVGFAGSFHPDLTGEQNTRFVARIYNTDTAQMIHFVRDFAELGQHFHLPVRSYSSGMKSRLAFGVSMAIRFDTYLVDEVTSVGDANFKEKSKTVFKARMQKAGAIVVSHSNSMLRDICDMGAVLDGGRLTMFEDLDLAIDVHGENMRRSRLQPAQT